MSVSLNPNINSQRQVSFTNTNNVHVIYNINKIPFNIKVLLDSNTIGGFGLGGFGEGGFGENSIYSPLFIGETINYTIFYEDNEFVVILPTPSSGKIIYWI